MTKAGLTSLATELSGSAFTPFASYNSVGDHIRFLRKPDMYFAERIDDLLTAYISFETKEMIGGQIKGIEALRQSAPAVHQYFFHRGSENLDVIIIAVASNSKQSVNPSRLREFIDVARAVGQQVKL